MCVRVCAGVIVHVCACMCDTYARTSVRVFVRACLFRAGSFRVFAYISTSCSCGVWERETERLGNGCRCLPHFSVSVLPPRSGLINAQRRVLIDSRALGQWRVRATRPNRHPTNQTTIYLRSHAHRPQTYRDWFPWDLYPRWAGRRGAALSNRRGPL